MSELLRGIETLAAVEALKASFYVYPLVNALHVMAIGAVFTSVVLMDLALLGLLNRLPPVQAVALFRPVALAAFGVAAVTGVALFAVNASEYAFNPAFRIKLVLLLVAAANLLMFSRLHAGDGQGLSAPARVSALGSILLWTGILVAGRFIGFL